MQQPWKVLLAGILQALVLVGLGRAPALAVQNFTDEAG